MDLFNDLPEPKSSFIWFLTLKLKSLKDYFWTHTKDLNKRECEEDKNDKNKKLTSCDGESKAKEVSSAIDQPKKETLFYKAFSAAQQGERDSMQDKHVIILDFMTHLDSTPPDL